jgi:CDP-glycerol glycerophosphotransferase (TagB/SpsB family)
LLNNLREGIKVMNIIIFGTGSCCEKTLLELNYDEVKIIGFCDNDKNKQNKIFNGRLVYNPENILNLEYDLILIASQYSTQIYEQLTNMGINSSKIIPVLYEDYLKKSKEYYVSILNSIKVKKNKNRDKKYRKKIALLKKNNSGSNTLAMYKNIPDYINKKYDVELIKINEPKDIKKILQDNNFDLICSTHLNSLYDENILNVELWHGFPLKKIGTRTNLFYNSFTENKKKNITKVVSYSELYSSLFNASFPNSPDKYEICGMPRNDLLFIKNKDLMIDLFGKEIINKKVIIYMPTYRVWKVDMNVNGNRGWDNIFGFDEFDLLKFVNYLRENNLFFICKLHHMEYNQLNEEEYIEYSDVVRFINELDLEEWQIDLYEVLANIDLLITDYSSVYFDMLLKDIPMLFIPTDKEFYEKNRGFNFEPYEFWTPGPKVYNQSEFFREIDNVFRNDIYIQKRAELRSIVHNYIDNNSSFRVWKMIDELLINMDSNK